MVNCLPTSLQYYDKYIGTGTVESSINIRPTESVYNRETCVVRNLNINDITVIRKLKSGLSGYKVRAEPVIGSDPFLALSGQDRNW